MYIYLGLLVRMRLSSYITTNVGWSSWTKLDSKLFDTAELPVRVVVQLTSAKLKSLRNNIGVDRV